MVPVPPSRVGPWEVTDTLGRGGMGAVYRARRDGGPERALKVLLRSGDVKGALRLAREAANLARVRHPNVVAVHEVAADERGHPYLVMDLVAGSALERLLEAGPVRPLARALELMAAVARGVDALHEAGIVHRDLKPANIIVTADGRPVVIDLGLAIAPELDERLTRTGALVGTPRYMAPEQVSGKPATPATDVHALGLILHEVVTGAPAVAGDSTHELVAQLIAGVEARPTKVDPTLPVALDHVVARCLTRDPAARPARAAEVAALLDGLRDTLRDGAGGPSATDVRRRRLAAFAGGGLALLLLVLGLARAGSTGDGSGPTPTTAPPPEPTTTATPKTGASPTPADRAEAERAAKALERLPVADRVVRADAWLARWPGEPGAARVREARARALREAPERWLPHPRVEGAAFVDPAGARAVTWGSDLQVRLWDVARAEVLSVWTAPWPMSCAGLSADGATLVVGGQEALAVLDVERLERPRLFPVAVPIARRLAVSPRGDRAVVTGVDGVLRVLDLASGREVLVITAHRNQVNSILFTPDGARLLTGSGKGMDQPGVSDCAARVLDASTGEVLTRVELVFQANDVRADGADGLLVCGNGSRVLRYALDGTPRGELHGEGTSLAGAFDSSPPAMATTARHALVTPDGALIVAVTGETDPGPANELRLWDGRTGAQRRRIELPASNTLELSADGHRAIVASVDGTVTVWSVDALGTPE